MQNDCISFRIFMTQVLKRTQETFHLVLVRFLEKQNVYRTNQKKTLMSILFPNKFRNKLRKKTEEVLIELLQKKANTKLLKTSYLDPNCFRINPK